MKYFVDCTSIEEAKKLYKKLCFKYHPDMGGSVEIMQEVNAEYSTIMEKLAFIHNINPENDNKQYDYKNDKFAEIIQKIITYNIDIEIIGSWIWCFNSYEYHEQLKDLGFWYSSTKKAWVYSGMKKRAIRSKNKVDDLRAKYGSETVKNRKTQIKIA